MWALKAAGWRSIRLSVSEENLEAMAKQLKKGKCDVVLFVRSEKQDTPEKGWGIEGTCNLHLSIRVRKKRTVGVDIFLDIRFTVSLGD